MDIKMSISTSMNMNLDMDMEMNMDTKTNMNMNNSIDRPVMATADDAIQTKQAAVDAGYYNDPFLAAFSQARSAFSTSGGRRQVQPIIKRGTHARVCVMDRAISSFLNNYSSGSGSGSGSGSDSSNSNDNDNVLGCQIVVLGAGKDTSYFRFCSGSIMGQEPKTLKGPTKVNWYEVDHAAIIQEKIKIIQGSPLLSSHCVLQTTANGYSSMGNSKDNSSFISSYHLIQHDLRESNLFEKIQLDPKVPTLLLLECVFMYLPSNASKTLLNEIATHFKQQQHQQYPHTFMVAYEPILGHDPFGRMMEQNLKKAGVVVTASTYNPNNNNNRINHDNSIDEDNNPCLLQARTLQDQLNKWIQAGFEKAVACDMWSAYQTILTPDQRARANQCEFLDEMEEWIMIMQHYCFLAARIGSNAVNNSNQNEHAWDLTLVGNDSPLGFMEGKCQVKK